MGDYQTASFRISRAPGVGERGRMPHLKAASLGIYSIAASESIGNVGNAAGHGVGSRGGWMQGQFNFTDRWQLNLSYGIDAPNTLQLPVGNRFRNQMYMGNIFYKWRLNVNFGWEYRRLLTDFRNQIPANE